ncbi:unnamed protein product [Orchesella dallaii]|uniref:Uncharacterized protein n=1 Tax=Orchesella dallaii TaxID=48710 RepID=A0ABP1R3X1_9HEXA
MDKNRYPRICFEALKVDEKHNLTYSWTDQVKAIFDKFGMSYLSHETDINNYLLGCPMLLTNILDGHRQSDIDAVNSSTRHSYYKTLVPDLPISASYLSLKIPYKKAMIIAQARLNNGQFYHNKFAHTLDGNMCTLCNLPRVENLKHFMMESLVLIIVIMAVSGVHAGWGALAQKVLGWLVTGGIVAGVDQAVDSSRSREMVVYQPPSQPAPQNLDDAVYVIIMSGTLDNSEGYWHTDSGNEDLDETKFEEPDEAEELGTVGRAKDNLSAQCKKPDKRENAEMQSADEVIAPKTPSLILKKQQRLLDKEKIAKITKASKPCIKIPKVSKVSACQANEPKQGYTATPKKVFASKLSRHRSTARSKESGLNSSGLRDCSSSEEGDGLKGSIPIRKPVNPYIIRKLLKDPKFDKGKPLDASEVPSVIKMKISYGDFRKIVAMKDNTSERNAEDFKFQKNYNVEIRKHFKVFNKFCVLTFYQKVINNPHPVYGNFMRIRTKCKNDLCQAEWTFYVARNAKENQDVVIEARLVNSSIL